MQKSPSPAVSPRTRTDHEPAPHGRPRRRGEPQEADDRVVTADEFATHRATHDAIGTGMAMEMLSRLTGADPDDDDDLRDSDLDDGMMIRRTPNDSL